MIIFVVFLVFGGAFGQQQSWRSCTTDGGFACVSLRYEKGMPLECSYQSTVLVSSFSDSVHCAAALVDGGGGGGGGGSGGGVEWSPALVSGSPVERNTSHIKLNLIYLNQGKYLRFSVAVDVTATAIRFSTTLDTAYAPPPAATNHSATSLYFPRFGLPSKNSPNAADIVGLSFYGMWDYGTFLTSMTIATTYRGDIVDGGTPLVLYDRRSFDTLVVSPSSSFKSTTLANVGGGVACGASSYLLTLPADHEFACVFSFSQLNSVTNSMLKWGDELLKQSNKVRQRYESNVVASMLGYYTDNGAYYYDRVVEKDYATSLPLLVESFRVQRVPIRYFQLDSWWYEWGDDHGVSLWEPRRDNFTFPSGSIPPLGMPTQLHNRFWSKTTKMRQRDIEFVNSSVGERGGVGLGESFPSTSPHRNQLRLFNDIMSKAKRDYALAVYEQDWLSPQFSSMRFPLQHVGEAEQWLEAMDEAARKQAISVLYCMPNRADYLISTKLKQVQMIRVSDDYLGAIDPSKRETTWRIALPNLMAWSVGLLPTKDVFWSSTTSAEDYRRPGNVPMNASEPNVGLTALVAALSAGQVAPGDRIHRLNRTLLAYTHRADGRLLRPNRPAMPVDDVVFRYAGGVFNLDMIDFSYTMSVVAGHERLASYCLAVNFTNVAGPLVRLSPTSFGETSSTKYVLAVLGVNGNFTFDSRSLALVSSSSPFSVPLQRSNGARPRVPFAFYGFYNLKSCRSGGGGVAWALLGEAFARFITVSEDRFRSFSIDDSCRLRVTAVGVAGETIRVAAAKVVDASPPSLQQQTITFTVTDHPLEIVFV